MRICHWNSEVLEFINWTSPAEEVSREYLKYFGSFILKEDEEDRPSFDVFREVDNDEHQRLTPEVFIQGNNVLKTIEEFRK